MSSSLHQRSTAPGRYRRRMSDPRPFRTVEAVLGDITAQRVDAVVNAANHSLLGGGGVDGALHRVAGPGLLEACREVRRTAYPDGLPVGEAVATTGADLAARWVVHTVGPNWHRGERDPGRAAPLLHPVARRRRRGGRPDRRRPRGQRRCLRVGPRDRGPDRRRRGPRQRSRRGRGDGAFRPLLAACPRRLPRLRLDRARRWTGRPRHRDHLRAPAGTPTSNAS